jgi:hypothetical protein
MEIHICVSKANSTTTPNKAVEIEINRFFFKPAHFL